jgi:hypothetical protein
VTRIYHDFGYWVKGFVALGIIDMKNTQVPKYLGPRPQLKVTSEKFNGGAKDLLALFRVSDIEGVRGAHIRDRGVVKPEIPFR